MLDNLDDEKLVELAKKGDKTATDELLKKYSPLVKRNARSFFLIGGETEDLIQEGMCGLYFAINDFDANHNYHFKSFASMCIKRRIISVVKQSTRQKSMPLNNYTSLFNEDGEENVHILSEQTPEEIVISNERRDEVLAEVKRQLSSMEYQIFMLYMKGKSYSEISEQTKKTFKSIDNALQRSKQKVAKILSKG